MKIGYLADIKNFKPSVLAIGVFDGVHKGHLKILNKTKEIADKYKLTGSVLTFYPHPLSVLKPHIASPLIGSLKERLRILKQVGIGQVVVAKFTKDFSEKSPLDFIKEIVLKKLNAKWVVVGSDYHFGKGETGDERLLEKLAKELNFKVTIIEPLKLGKHKIGSSLIRTLLTQGRLGKAARYLGRYYSVIGKVKKGSQRGKILKFPTANIAVPPHLLLKDGVYAGWVAVDGERKKAVINVGKRPTFEGKERLIEIHIFNFNKNIYNKEIEVFFAKRLRAEKKFKKADDLARQLNHDSRKAKKALESVAL